MSELKSKKSINNDLSNLINTKSRNIVSENTVNGDY